MAGVSGASVLKACIALASVFGARVPKASVPIASVSVQWPVFLEPVFEKLVFL